MRRPISWTENTPEGKKEYRVQLTADSVRWQVLPPHEEKWQYDYQPTEDEWLLLETKVENYIQRGHFYKAELEVVKRRGARKK